MPISYVGSAGSGDDNGNEWYTLTKPTGVQSGDLMIAILAFYATYGGVQRTVSVPAGWTRVSDKYVTASSRPHQICVMRRTAGASEPGSWSATISADVEVAAMLTLAYRGASGIAVSATSSTGASSSYSTGTVNNAAPTSWRLTLAGYSSASLAYEIDSNELVEREIAGIDASTAGVQIGAWDSGGTVATGNTSRTISRGASWGSSCSWIGILTASIEATTGSLEVATPLVSVDMTATPSHDGPLAATLPMPTMTGDAISTPPEGPLDIAVIPVVDIAAAVVPTGAMGVEVPPIFDFEGETRVFGIRVIAVEAEEREVVPRLGADTTFTLAPLSFIGQGGVGGDALNVSLLLPQVSFNG